MSLLNVNTSGIEKMQTKDAIQVLNTLLQKFPKAKQIYTCNFVEINDRVFEKMLKIEVLVQVQNEAGEDLIPYHLKGSRAKDFSCSNSFTITELSKEDFQSELYFFKKFNQ